MGCNIHIYAEKQAKDGRWVTLCPLEGFSIEDRWYIFFAMLTDGQVRWGYEELPVHFPVRGFPDDAGDTTRYFHDEVWRHYKHSASWLTYDEMERCWYEAYEYVRRKYPHMYDTDDGEQCPSFIDSLPDWIRWEDGVRFVFWFDN